MRKMKANLSKIKFVDSIPADGRGRGVGLRGEFINQLRTKRGKWAEYPMDGYRTAPTMMAHTLRRDFDGIEAVSRGDKVYVRWVG